MEFDSMVFYRSFRDAIEALPEEHRAGAYAAILGYALDGTEYDGNDGCVMAMYLMAKPNIDANAKKREAGKRGGEASGKQTASKTEKTESKQEANAKQTQANAKQTQANAKQTQANAKQTPSKTEKTASNEDVDVDEDVDGESNNNVREAHAPSQAPQKHKHGQYGWVKLTDKEYNQLILEFGKDKADRFIDVVDEYTESNGNKNKYKGWNVVVRKAIRENWGGAPEPKNRGKPYEPPDYDGEFDFLEHVGER